MFDHRIIAGLVSTAATGALVVPVVAPAGAVEVDLMARVHATAAFPTARGHAEYDSDGHAREFEISLAGVQVLAGRRVTVRVHGDLVGRTTVRADGRAHLHRHAGVPRVSRGDVVKVRTGTGALVAGGTFHADVND